MALVVELQSSGNYLGQTILTLPMAYIDARLVCRPGSEWLDTQKIDPAAGTADPDDEDRPRATDGCLPHAAAGGILLSKGAWSNGNERGDPRAACPKRDDAG